jgi:osmotically-inducible protein OsmY
MKGPNAMTTIALTATDLVVRDAVLQQLSWDSQVEASGIGVTAKDGAVTLTGYIDSYAGKLAAERAAKRVRGVRSVANEIQVRLRLERTDSDIAADAARALRMRITLPESVQAMVHSGHITLTGTVSTLFQRAVAEKSVKHVLGVKGIVNRITVTQGTSDRDMKREIVRALHRDAEANARAIEVHVFGDVVRLTGEVQSWHEREAAERAAMHAPGITQVDNRITIAWPDEISAGVGMNEMC